MPKDLAPSASLLVLNWPSDAPRIVTVDLRKAKGLYDELARRNQASFFPKDLPPALVHAHLQKHLDEELAHGKATASQAEAVKRLAQLNLKAGKMKSRLLGLVDSGWPHGTPERAAFFPPGQGNHALSQEFLAFAHGIHVHDLPGLPLDLSEAEVRGMGHALAQAETARAQVGLDKEASSTTRSNLDEKTSDIATRLGKTVRSHYGVTNKELLAYGLNVQSVSRGGGRKPKPVPAAKAQEGPEA